MGTAVIHAPTYAQSITEVSPNTRHLKGINKEYMFDIPIMPLSQSLTMFSDHTESSYLFSYDLVNGKSGNPVVGRYTPQQALNVLLKGTGFEGQLTADRLLLVTPLPAALANYDKTDEEKMKTKKSILATIFAFLFTSTAGAQEGTDLKQTPDADKPAAEQKEGKQSWERIEVTATKRSAWLQDVPLSVFAQTGDRLNDRGVDDLQSLSIAVPSLFVAESGSWQRRISIRGIGNSYGSSSLVGMYLDEASVATIPVNQIDLRVFDLERVEVLKGPQGTLYGEGSVGGTIRYVTKDPILDLFEGNAQFGLSSIKNGGTSKILKGVVNAPVIDNEFGVRIAAQYNDFGGWIDQPAVSKTNINEYELYNVRAKFIWAPTDNLEMVMTAITHRNNVGAQNIGENEDGNYEQVLNEQSTPSGNDDYDLYNLVIDYNYNSLSFVSATGYLNSKKELFNLGNECCVSDGLSGYWDLFIPNTQINSEVLTQEFRMNGNLDDIYFNSGVYFKKADYLNSTINNVVLGEGDIVFFEIQPFSFLEKSESYAIFGEAEYHISDQIVSGFGLRYFKDKRKYVGEDRMQNGDFRNISPKLFLSYFLEPSFHIYGNLSFGFRSGGFNDVGEPNYQPEEVRTYELGTKFSSFGGRIDAEFAVFFSEYDDYQIVGVDPTTFLNVTSNAGDAEIKGGELSVKYFIGEDFQLGIAGNYMDTEFTEVNLDSSSHAVGDPLDLVPEYGYSIWANYMFNWGNTSSTLTLDYSQQGPSYYRNRSSGADYAGKSNVISLLNMNLNWKFDSYDLELYITNILNERGYLTGMSIEKLSPRPQPRTFGANLKFIF